MTKKIFPLLALAALFAACSDKDNPGFDTPTIPDGDVKQNIVENTQYGSYIDWQTYAGDDFYRYATGAWQDATDLGDRNVVGTLQVQDELMDEFLAKVCKGGCPPLQRLFTQY